MCREGCDQGVRGLRGGCGECEGRVCGEGCEGCEGRV